MKIKNTELSRRKFIVKSVAAGSLIMLLPQIACGTPVEKADGSFERPWTSKDTINFDERLEKPVAYISETSIEKGLLRLWVEVLDSETLTVHPQAQEHFISQLIIKDDQGNRIFAQKYTAGHQAKLIFTTKIPDEIATIHIYRECSKHGWWKESFLVQNKDFIPKGDLRRAYTNESGGPFTDKKVGHIPQLFKLENQQYRIEIGDRKQQKLHPMEDDHYISEIIIYDDYNQQLLQTTLSPDFNQEAVIITKAFENTKWIRILAKCNQHHWWQTIFNL